MCGYGKFYIIMMAKFSSLWGNICVCEKEREKQKETCKIKKNLIL